MNVVPLRYRVALDLDLEAGSYQGREEVEVQVREPTATIRLHAVDLEITRAVVWAAGKRYDASVALAAGDEQAVFTVYQPLPVGPARLSLTFSGKLRDDLRGLYRVRVGDETMAFTQFEATDARRAFPCWDEPAAKARFTLTVTAPEDRAIISNTAPASTRKRGGRKTVRFAETPVLSTYLIALAVGRLTATARRVGDVPVAVWSTPDKAHLRELALDATAAVLPLLEEYFDIPYAYGKLDLVAVPDFAAGAMENAGAIFFREILLLLDPEESSLGARRALAQVLAHEVAHQWFGNLVTMKWWDDLWLNEAFATWMEVKVVDRWRPEWNLWLDFQQRKGEPLAVDALRSSRAIRAPVSSAAEAEEMFDAITYSKGAAVLRMLEGFVGEQAFRDGVRAYLRAHREANATHEDLWRAIGEASGRPIGEIARTWIEQPGYPLVRLTPVARDGQTVVLAEQARYFSRPEEAGQGAGERWQVPLCLRYDGGAGPRVRCELLAGERGEIALPDAGPCPTWLVGNADEAGYFRVALPGSWVEAQAAHVAALSVHERLGLLSNAWALVLSGEAPIADFLTLLRAMRGERARQVVEAVAGFLARLDDVLLDEADRPAFSRLVQELLGPRLAELGWDGAPDEDEDRRLLRPTVIGAIGWTGRDPAVVAEAERRLARFFERPEALDPQLRDTVLSLAARAGDPARYDEYLRRYRQAATPEDEVRFLFARTAFEAPDLADRTLAALLTDEVKLQEVGRILAGMFSRKAVRLRAWAFARAHWQDLLSRIPPFSHDRVVRSLGALCDQGARAEIAEFFARPENRPKGPRALAQALDRLDTCLSLRRRATADFAAWLRAR